RNRHNEARNHRGHQHRAARQLSVVVYSSGVATLPEAPIYQCLQAFARRTETPEQGVDGERHNAQYSNFTVSIKAAEIDQQDIDNIGSAAFRQGFFKVK